MDQHHVACPRSPRRRAREWSGCRTGRAETEGPTGDHEVRHPAAACDGARCDGEALRPLLDMIGARPRPRYEAQSGAARSAVAIAGIPVILRHEERTRVAVLMASRRNSPAGPAA